MKAEVGDRIVVASGTLHRPIRDGEILQVGEGGVGPYLVRWSDSGNESLFFPGPDAHVEHVQRESGAAGGQQSSAAPRTQPTQDLAGRHLSLRRSGLNVGERRTAQ